MKQVSSRPDAWTSEAVPRTAWFALLGTWWLLAGIVCIRTGYVQEDAMILARFVEHALAGEGLAYNPGDPVYGFSSPLFLLLSIAVARVLPAGSTTLALRVAGVGAFMAASWFLLRLLLHAHVTKPPAGAPARPWRTLLPAALLLVMDFPLLLNAGNGMEGPLVALLLAAAISSQVRNGPPGPDGVLWGLAVLARPDAVFPVGALFLFALCENRRLALTQALVAALVCLPWEVFCLLHFEIAIPQTILAKAGAYSHGTSWAAGLTDSFATSFAGLFGQDYKAFGVRWFSASGYALLAAIGAICSFRTPVSSRLIAVLATYMLYFGFSGANQFPWYFVGPRSLMLILAVQGCDALLGSRRLNDGVRYALTGAGLAALTAVLLIGTTNMANIQRYYENGVRAQTGRFISDRASKKDTLFTESLGYIGYFADLRTYDYPGLVTPGAGPFGGSPPEDYARIIGLFRPRFLALRVRERERITQATPLSLQDYELLETIRLPSEAPAYMRRSGWAAYEVWRRRNAPDRRP